MVTSSSGTGGAPRKRALGNIEAFVGPLDLGDRAGGIDRDQHRRRIRAFAKQALHKRQVSLGQRHHQQQRADLLGLHRAARVRRRDVLEGDIGVAEIVFLLQDLDDAVIDFAADHADGMVAQLGDAGDGRSRRRHDHHDAVRRQRDGSGLLRDRRHRPAPPRDRPCRRRRPWPHRARCRHSRP